MINLKTICAGLIILGAAYGGSMVPAQAASADPITTAVSADQQATGTDKADVPIKVGDPIIIKDKKPLCLAVAA